jgi:hypothetical protein
MIRPQSTGPQIMLVSHTAQFIFFKTVKTGGTSVELALQKLFLPRSVAKKQPFYEDGNGIVGARGASPAKENYWSHMTALEVYRKLGYSTFNRYRRISIVRNPFDKVVSQFFFREHRGENFAVDKTKFNAYVRAAQRLPVDRNIYSIKKIICCTHLMFYERLQEDFNAVLRELSGGEHREAELGRHKAGFRDKSIPYQDYYDPDSRDLVAKAFDFELENFGYSFAGKGLPAAAPTASSQQIAG